MTATIEQTEQARVYEATGFRIQDEERQRSSMEREMVKTWQGEDRWEKGKCKVCGFQLPYDDDDVDYQGIKGIFTTVCDGCGEITDEHFDGDGGKVASLTPKWSENCPLLFQDITLNLDLSRNDINLVSYKKVADWRYNKQGMYISGDSGKGKTAAIWALCRNIERETGTAPQVIKAVALAGRLARSAKDLDVTQVTWMIRRKVLIIDDLGKEKITPSFTAQLFEVINGRYEQFRPTIVTTKFRGESLKKRFSNIGEDSTGNDIIRRLGQTCEAIDF